MRWLIVFLFTGSGPAIAAPSQYTFAKEMTKYACTRGLRSIPYLIISNIELQTTSVLHLCHIVAAQRASAQLLNALPPGKTSSIPESAGASRSLIWQPHVELPVKAKRLLEVVESLREIKEKPQLESNPDDEAAEEEDEDTTRKNETKLKLERTRLLKRVRIEAIKKDGVQANQVALAALKMGLLARILLLDEKDRPVWAPEPVQDTEPAAEELGLDNSVLEQEEEQAQMQEHLDEESFAELPPSPEQVHAEPQNPVEPAFVTGPFHPSAALFDTEFPALKPVTPKLEPRTLHELSQALNADTSLSSANGTTEHEDRIDIKEDSPDSKASGTDASTNGTEAKTNDADSKANGTGHTRPSGGKGHPRGNGPQKEKKKSWLFGFKAEDWAVILSNLVGAEAILDEQQQNRILHYASDWDSLAYEMSIQGAEECQQVWKYLDTVDCFSYSTLP